MRTLLVGLSMILIAAVSSCSNASSANSQPVKIDSSTACFTPGDNCTALIVDAIGAAKDEIFMQAYSFTSKPIAEALAKAHRRGVKVVAVLDHSNESQTYSGATFLANVGIPTYIDDAHKIAHNKVIVIDNRTVITGSFNFTTAAQKNNAENVLILQSADMAKLYRENFIKHQKHSQQMAAKY